MQYEDSNNPEYTLDAFKKTFDLLLTVYKTDHMADTTSGLFNL